MTLKNEILISIEEYTQTNDKDIIVDYLANNLNKDSHLTRYGNFGLDNSGLKNSKNNYNKS